MVTVVVVEREVVLAGVAGICRRLAVALLELVLVDATVPQREAADIMLHKEFLTRGAVFILRLAAVGEVYPTGVVVGLVGPGMAYASTLFSHPPCHDCFGSLQI